MCVCVCVCVCVCEALSLYLCCASFTSVYFILTFFNATIKCTTFTFQQYLALSLWVCLAGSFPSREGLSLEGTPVSRVICGFIFSSKPYFENGRGINWDCSR